MERFILPYGAHRFTKVWVCDNRGQGNAHHEYVVTDVEQEDPYSPTDLGGPHAVIHFQNGPVKEKGKNGCFIEDLLHIVMHRLECFQSGNFACEENAKALAGVQQALYWLDKRTSDRQSRGVEGTNVR